MKTKNILVSWTRPAVSGTIDGIAVEPVANQPDVPQWPRPPGSRPSAARCAARALPLDLTHGRGRLRVGSEKHMQRTVHDYLKALAAGDADNAESLFIA